MSDRKIVPAYDPKKIVPLIYIEDSTDFIDNIQDELEISYRGRSKPYRLFRSTNLEEAEQSLGHAKLLFSLPPIIIVDLDLQSNNSPDWNGLFWLISNRERFKRQRAKILVVSANITAAIRASLSKYDILPENVFDKDDVIEDGFLATVAQDIEIIQSQTKNMNEDLTTSEIAVKSSDIPDRAACEFRIYFDGHYTEKQPIQVLAGIPIDLVFEIEALPHIDDEKYVSGRTVMATCYSPDTQITPSQIELAIPKFGGSPASTSTQVIFSKNSNSSYRPIRLYVHHRNRLISTLQIYVQVL